MDWHWVSIILIKLKIFKSCPTVQVSRRVICIYTLDIPPLSSWIYIQKVTILSRILAESVLPFLHSWSIINGLEFVSDSSNSGDRFSLLSRLNYVKKSSLSLWILCTVDQNERQSFSYNTCSQVLSKFLGKKDKDPVHWSGLRFLLQFFFFTTLVFLLPAPNGHMVFDKMPIRT
jgi:hypothetical protein